MAPPRPTTGPFADTGTGLAPPPSKPKAKAKKKPPAKRPANPTLMDRKPAKKQPALPPAFRSPPISSVLGPVPDAPLLPPGPPLKEPDRLRVAATVAAAKRERAAEKRLLDTRVKQHQTDQVLADIAARNGLTTPGSPFAGVASGAPARHEHTFTPALTGEVGLARARQQLRTQGGLGLTPAQLKAQKKAERQVEHAIRTKPSFHDRAQLPANLVYGGGLEPGVPAPQQYEPPPPPPKQPQKAQPGPRTGMAGYYEKHKDDPASIVDWKDALKYGVQGLDHAGGFVVGGFNNGLGIGYSGDPFTAGWSLATGGGIPEGYRRHMRAEERAGIGGIFPSSAGEISKVTQAGLPDVSQIAVPARYVVGGVSQVAHTKGLSTDTAEAADGTMPAEDAAAIGFTPEYTKILTQLALKRGWYKGELTGLVGMDLMAHAYGDPPPMALRVAQNFGRGAAQTAAAMTGFAALGSEIAHGHGMRAFGQLGGALAEEGAGFLHNPLQAAVSDPFTVVPAVGAAGKTLGLAGHLPGLLARASGRSVAEMGLREIPTGMYPSAHALRELPEGVAGPVNPEIMYGRGQYSRNTWTRTGQWLSDKAVSKGYGLKDEHRRNFDRLVRSSINQAAHGHTSRQVAYRSSLKALEGRLSGKKKRAEVLLTYLHNGGKPENALRMYEDRIASGELNARDLAAAQAQVEFLRDVVIPQTRNLSEADQNFIAAARDISAHTSLTHIELGRFRRGAMLWRQLEPLILAAQERSRRVANPAELTPEMEAADQLGVLREMVLNPEKGPEGSPGMALRSGKLGEATRAEGKGLEWYQEQLDKVDAESPGPRPVDPGAEPHKAAVAAHKAAAPVKAEPPPKGPQGPFPTKYQAGKAGKEAKEKHGAIQHKVREVPETIAPGAIERTAGKARPSKQGAVDAAAEMAAAARKEHKGKGYTVRGGVEKDGRRYVPYIEVQAPKVKSGGHFTYELVHPPAKPTPGWVSYKRRLKKYEADNPKPVGGSAVHLKAWEDARPKPPKTAYAKAKEAHKAATPVRDPAELAAHAEAVAKWEQATAIWKAKRREALGALKAHQRHVNRSGGRRRTLATSEAEQLRKVSDPEAIYAQYVQHLEDFLQMHLDSGGIVPARVAYTKKPLKSARRYAARGGARLNVKKDARRDPKVNASTGRSFKSGAYLVDANSPIRDSMHAQRLRVGLGVHKLLVDHVAKIVPPGTEVAEGEVAVSVKNMATLAPAEHRFDPESSISHQSNYEAEYKLRSKRQVDLEDMAKPGTGDFTVSEPSYIIPKAAWDRMLEWTKPVPQTKYNKFWREYQRMLISIFPGTVIGNTLGSMPLAWAAGAGPRSFYQAARTMRRGGHNRELAPHYLYGSGPAGSLEVDAHQFWTHGMNKMRSASIAGEDFSRIAAYWSKAFPIVKREGERIQKEAEQARKDFDVAHAEHTKALGEHESFIGPGGPAHPGEGPGVPPEVLDAKQAFDEAARQFAAGKLHPGQLDQVLQHVEKFMGDTHRPFGDLGSAIQRTHVILFQNWVAHMAKLVLYSLPVKHPRRTLFLNTMARYGDQWRQENGAWPSWMVGFIPLFSATAAVPGIQHLPGGAELQHWSHVFSLQQLNPQSTAGGLVEGLTADKPIGARLAGAANPALQAGYNIITQANDNRGASPDKQIDLWRMLLNEGLGMIPGERKLFPSQGLRYDTLPFSDRPKIYRDPITGQLRDPFLNPGARADRGPSGFIERFFGVGGYQVPNQGVINNQQIDEQAYRALLAQNPSIAAGQERKQAELNALHGRAMDALKGP